MRAEYAAVCRGPDPFPALIAAAYGLQRPTAESVYCDERLVCRPRPKLLTQGSERDRTLEAMAIDLERRAGPTRFNALWRVEGRFTFDGSLRQVRWIRECAIPHAHSFLAGLKMPCYDEWMAQDGEQRLAEYEARLASSARPRRQRRDDARPYEIDTTIRRLPVLDMLTRGQYPERYCPRTVGEELQGVLVAETDGGYISIGRGFEPARHGHKASLWLDDTLWMSTAPAERMCSARAARACPDRADAFVGGLGLGLVLMHLGPRCRAITVAERDERVIRMVWPRLAGYLGPRHGSLELRLLYADAYDAVAGEPGRYDYVYFDIWPDPPSAEQRRATHERVRASQPQAKVMCWIEDYDPRSRATQDRTRLLDTYVRGGAP